jgi:hypothetical protein
VPLCVGARERDGLQDPSSTPPHCRRLSVRPSVGEGGGEEAHRPHHRNISSPPLLAWGRADLGHRRLLPRAATATATATGEGDTGPC